MNWFQRLSQTDRMEKEARIQRASVFISEAQVAGQASAGLNGSRRPPRDPARSLGALPRPSEDHYRESRGTLWLVSISCRIFASVRVHPSQVAWVLINRSRCPCTRHRRASIAGIQPVQHCSVAIHSRTRPRNRGPHSAAVTGEHYPRCALRVHRLLSRQRKVAFCRDGNHERRTHGAQSGRKACPAPLLSAPITASAELGSFSGGRPPVRCGA